MHRSFLFILAAFMATNAVTTTTNVFRFEPITVLEEPPIGTLLLDLAAKLNIHDVARVDYKFRFYSPHSLASRYFLIDPLTGHVKTQRTIDREYLCETKVCGACQLHVDANCTLPVEIVLNGRNGPHEQKFVSFDVLVEDKNEFAPQFPHARLQLNVSEAAPVNFEMRLEAARDRDSRPSRISYSLAPLLPPGAADEDVEEFAAERDKLNEVVRVASAAVDGQLTLVLREPVDYEAKRELSFRVVASDGQLSGSCVVTLNIVDVNDNLPVFDQAEYEYRLEESEALPGTRLIRVHATDLDDGLNGLVKYALVEQTFADAQQVAAQSLRVRDLFKIGEYYSFLGLPENLVFNPRSEYHYQYKYFYTHVSELIRFDCKSK